MIDAKGAAILLLMKDKGAARFKDLARVIHNSRTLSLKLRKLQSSGLVRREENRYKITETGKKVASLLGSYMEIVSGDKPRFQNLERIPHRVLAPLVGRYCELLHDAYKERLEGIMIFGSVARGDWNEYSDIDILVVVRGWERMRVWERISELGAIKDELARAPEFSGAVKEGFWPVIQHVPLDLEELGRFGTIYLDVVFDGLLLFDRGGLMKGFVDSIRGWAERADARRVTLPDGRSYWTMKQARAGEIVELGQ